MYNLFGQEMTVQLEIHSNILALPWIPGQFSLDSKGFGLGSPFGDKLFGQLIQRTTKLSLDHTRVYIFTIFAIGISILVR